VSDLDQSIQFYSGVMGFEVMQRYGDQAAFLSAGGYHHHIGLNTWESKGGARPPRGTTGLYHTAFLYPDRKALAQALKQVIAAGVPIQGHADHGVSEAIYFEDPDGNGIEIYRDRDAADWPRTATGDLAMVNHPLDIPALLAEA
jgi:catechol 2,3-dioxygenase